MMNHACSSATRRELSYQQLKMILDNSYDEIYVFDGDGIIIYANDACERNYDLRVKDIIGKTVYECYQKYHYHPFLTPIVMHDRKRITLEHLS
ncbi:MAG: PAS domain-containing protein, partial [Clostridiales bacterium]